MYIKVHVSTSINCTFTSQAGPFFIVSGNATFGAVCLCRNRVNLSYFPVTFNRCFYRGVIKNMFSWSLISQSLTPRILLLQTDVTRHIIYVQGERKLLFDILIYIFAKLVAESDTLWYEYYCIVVVRSSLIRSQIQKSYYFELLIYKRTLKKSLPARKNFYNS